MKNKVITIVCTVFIILAVCCFVYIFINIGNEEVVTPNEKDDIPQESTNPREERPQNIVVTSRIGVQLKNIIRYSNVYASYITDEIDENGISDKARLLIALDKLYKKEEYKEYRQYSEEYNSTYITKVNMQNIFNDYFVNKNVENINADNLLIYDAGSDSFIIGPAENYSQSLSYAIEIPYKISEYSDRVELLAYRIYVVNSQEVPTALTQEETVPEDNEDAVGDVDDANIDEEEQVDNTPIIDNPKSIVTDLYYDKAKQDHILTSYEASLVNEQTQSDYIRQLINNGTIDSEKLEVVQYTFKVENRQYRLDSFKKVEKSSK